jgi:tetratricopeptide (TPR) repeat protein
MELRTPPEKPFLCLNMIVKNESKIIRRLLTSVQSIIDSVCICDTGSTDNTVELIEAFLKERGLPGVVLREPFRDFGYNRTFALQAAKDWGTYALLLDADMKLVIHEGFDKTKLTVDGYNVLQKNGGLEYYNIRIVRLDKGVSCISPTHEYYDFPPGCRTEQLKTLSINDVGDGGAKADKFERDVRLLLGGLEKEPRNERYHFYLANSYRDAGNAQEALVYYLKRIALGGWKEEVFYAAFEAGNMLARLGRHADAVEAWLDAWQRHPGRAESLYEIVKHYRVKGQQQIAQLFLDRAKQIPYPQNDVLFIKAAVYNYLMDYEQSIIAFYTGVPYNHRALYTLLEHEEVRHNVLDNYRFYQRCLAKQSGVRKWDFCGKREETVGGRVDSFTSSSPCFFVDEDGQYAINVRYVNYAIQGDGGYKFRHSDGKITTLQLFHRLDRDFKPTATHWISNIQHPERRYQGVEDCKVLAHKGSLHFVGTVEDDRGKIRIGSGVYDPTASSLRATAIPSPFGRDCEKNWCQFEDTNGDLRVVYEWSPLRIGRFEDGALRLEHEHETPAWFRHVRGSSHGCAVADRNEIWFLCHLVHYTTPRHYYHLVVVLDKETLRYKRCSTPFKFEGDCIEYALGFVVEETRVLFSYSQMDRTSFLLEVPRALLEREFDLPSRI